MHIILHFVTSNDWYQNRWLFYGTRIHLDPDLTDFLGHAGLRLDMADVGQIPVRRSSFIVLHLQINTDGIYLRHGFFDLPSFRAMRERAAGCRGRLIGGKIGANA